MIDKEIEIRRKEVEMAQNRWIDRDKDRQTYKNRDRQMDRDRGR
jgi:hypothetical protein